MINSIDEIAKHPIVFVLYRAGSSGEFFAHAITQSFDSITKTNYAWENQTRVKYFDCFKHSLNSGFDTVTEKRMVAGFNDFLDFNKPTGTTHIGLVHPKGNSLEILTEHFSHCPVIEIVTFDDISKNFQLLAANSKIPGAPTVTNSYNCTGYNCKKQLLVEWKDIMFDSKKVFDHLQEFLSTTGDFQKFCLNVNEYKIRNCQLLDQI
jgi:hypothetical protein